MNENESTKYKKIPHTAKAGLQMKFTAANT